MKSLFFVVSCKGSFVHFPEGNSQYDQVHQNLREGLYPLFQKDLLLVLYFFEVLVGTENAMVDPVLHGEYISAKGDKNSAEDTLVFESVLLLEVLKHGSRKCSDEEGEYLFERDHIYPN